MSAIYKKDNITITGKNHLVYGNNCTINADSCVIYGNNCRVNGKSCYINGNNSTVYGENHIINGDNTYLYANNCTLNGNNTKNNGLGNNQGTRIIPKYIKYVEDLGTFISIFPKGTTVMVTFDSVYIDDGEKHAPRGKQRGVEYIPPKDNICHLMISIDKQRYYTTSKLTPNEFIRQWAYLQNSVEFNDKRMEYAYGTHTGFVQSRGHV
uniref:Uncharacterized protein n=1 Tax=viral metagenome TaxID=1070528 RepID=A0A6C0JRK1_9ZZZZ